MDNDTDGSGPVSKLLSGMITLRANLIGGRKSRLVRTRRTSMLQTHKPNQSAFMSALRFVRAAGPTLFGDVHPNSTRAFSSLTARGWSALVRLHFSGLKAALTRARLT
jgi:hypothetical protein